MRKIEVTEIHKELDIVLEIISQMKEHSFKVKSWMISIFGAILVFSSSNFVTKESVKHFPFWTIPALLIIIVLIFWYLDAFFLKTEKLYRTLYNWNVKYRNQTDKYLYDVSTFKRKVNDETHNLKKDIPNMFFIMFSRTLVPFYTIPLLLAVVLLFKSIS